MELRQLRSLVALAEDPHFTRTAARLHLAQPALSQQIRRLEDEVGLQLVDRTTRRVALTDAGRLLAERAKRAMGELDAAHAELADLAGVRSGRVVIGAMQSLGPFDLTILLAAFNAQHPAVELSVREDLSDALLEHVRTDAVDLAFVSLTGEVDPEGLEVLPLLTEPLTVLLPPGHGLAGRRRLRMEELRAERFITFGEGAGLRHIIEAAAQQGGFAIDIAFETNEIERARAMVARGLGVTVVPMSDTKRSGPAVASAALSPTLSRDVTLIWRRDRRPTPAARAFLELARRTDPSGTPVARRTSARPPLSHIPAGG